MPGRPRPGRPSASGSEGHPSAPAGLSRRARLGAAIALALAAIAALGTAPASASGGGSGSTSGFPVTLATPAGRITITHRPARVISLSPSATEDLFAIGAARQVVAVDDDSDYPPSAPRTSLSGYTPNVEAIARYRPDLVVISYDAALVRSLGKLGIPVLYQSAPGGLAGAYGDLTQLGQATGDPSGAARVVATMRATLRSLVARAPHLATQPSYYYELDPTFYSATSSTLIGALLGLFHLRNIADAAKGASSGYPQLSDEYVLAADPQLIFLADTGVDGGQTAATVAKRPGWSVIAAVAHHDVFALNADIASRWGPRLTELAATVEQDLAAYAHRGVAGRTVSRAPADEVLPRRRRHLARQLAGSAVVLVAAATASLLVGPADLPVKGVLLALADKLPLVSVHSGLGRVGTVIVYQIRAPRVVLGGVVGAMLAMAGTAYQGVFQNPLADPYLLGVAAGAGLGATVVIVLIPAAAALAFDPLPLAAFAGAVTAVAATYVLGRTAGGAGRLRSSASLVLAGVAVAAFFTAIQTFLQQRSAQTLDAVYDWILGGLSNATWSQIWLIAPYVAVSAVVLLATPRLLDVMSVGDEEAETLGVRAGRVRLAQVTAATLGTGAVVAVSGLIGFVGIIVPHTVRLVVGPSYRSIMPLSALVGATFLILADLAARTVLSPAEIPLGVVTAVLGAPFFLVVLRQSRRLA